MEADIEYLLTRKICEVLTLLGNSEYNQEPIQEHVAAIAKFICDIRLRPESGESLRQCGTTPEPCSSPQKRALSDGEACGPVLKRVAVGGKDDGSPCLEYRPSPATSPIGPSPADDNCTTAVSWEQLDLNATASPNATDSESFCVYRPIRSASTSTGDGQLYPDSSNASSEPLPPVIPDGSMPHAEMKVVKSILLNCVKIHRKLGAGSQGEHKASVSSIVEGSQTLAKRISELDYEGAVQTIQSHTELENEGILSSCIESRYWDLILRRAEHLDPQSLPAPKGPPDGFTRAQKEATRLFMTELGLRATPKKQRECRRLWRILYDMRNAEVDKILLYRTKRFDSFCKGSRNDAEMSPTEIALRWEEIYGPQIDLLEARIEEECDGGLSGRSWLGQPFVAARLHVPTASWSSAGNPWHSRVEENSYGFTSESAEASNWQPVSLSDLLAAGDGPSNKSIFVALLPRDEKSLLVCPILTIEAGDFLGVFAGEIRHSEQFDHAHGIRGPSENIWLDYSRLTGTLNMVRVSMNEDEANVHICWGHYCEEDGSPAWWVSVRALRKIEPFEELTRYTGQTEQARLHQDLESARIGFRKSP